jgi:hypothetical protein
MLFELCVGVVSLCGFGIYYFRNKRHPQALYTVTLTNGIKDIEIPFYAENNVTGEYLENSIDDLLKIPEFATVGVKSVTLYDKDNYLLYMRKIT